VSSLTKRTVRWQTKSGEVRTGERWQARYLDDTGERHERVFRLRRDAQDWLDEQTAKLVSGTHVAPRKARTTVADWCDTWLEGYGTRRRSTVRQAEVHIVRIKATFGHYQIGQVRPSQVKAWCAALAAEGLEPSYVYALHARLAQIYADAIEDGLVARSPCSRKTSPPAGKQKPYVTTEEQVWALHDAMPEHLRPTVLLGAFVGMREAEVCGLLIDDLDLMRGVWRPAAQYPAEPLKYDTSKTSVAFGQTLALELSAHIKDNEERRKGRWVVTNMWGEQLTPWTLQRAIRSVRAAHADPKPVGHPKDCAGCLIPGLPETFSFHDLRHFFASMLIAGGADVKKVQAAMRHASAKTTLDTYSHLWPDSDDAIRSVGEAALQRRLARNDEERPEQTP
jgi:integrase